MIVQVDLDGPTLAQIDALARDLGLQAVGHHREARRRGEAIRRLLLRWATQDASRCGLTSTCTTVHDSGHT